MRHRPNFPLAGASVVVVALSTQIEWCRSLSNVDGCGLFFLFYAYRYSFSISLSGADEDGVVRFEEPIELCLDYDETTSPDAPSILVFDDCSSQWCVQ